MSVSWGAKDASEVINRTYSWLGRLNGKEIASATLVVSSGTVVLSNVSNTTDSVSATISGGKPCEDVVLVSTVVTDEVEPQTLEEAITLKVRDSASLNLGPSTSTKRQLIEMALEECALSGYEFDITPEETFSLLRRLDAMMAEWVPQGMDLGYNFPATFGAGDLEDYSGIPDAAIQGVTISLAFAKAPTMRKTLSVETKGRYSTSMAAIRAMTAKVPQMGWARSTPSGAGNRWWNSWGAFMPTGPRC